MITRDQAILKSESTVIFYSDTMPYAGVLTQNVNKIKSLSENTSYLLGSDYKC